MAKNPETGHEVGENSGHGHVWRRPDERLMRCGGPEMCRECESDLRWLADSKAYQSLKTLDDKRQFNLQVAAVKLKRARVGDALALAWVQDFVVEAFAKGKPEEWEEDRRKSMLNCFEFMMSHYRQIAQDDIRLN